MMRQAYPPPSRNDTCAPEVDLYPLDPGLALGPLLRGIGVILTLKCRYLNKFYRSKNAFYSLAQLWSTDLLASGVAFP